MSLVIPSGGPKGRSRGIAVVPTGSHPEPSGFVILSRQAPALEERSDEGKDPHRPDRGLFAGMTKILRLTPQDDNPLNRDDRESSTRLRSLGMTSNSSLT